MANKLTTLFNQLYCTLLSNWTLYLSVKEIYFLNIHLTNPAAFVSRSVYLLVYFPYYYHYYSAALQVCLLLGSGLCLF